MLQVRLGSARSEHAAMSPAMLARWLVLERQGQMSQRVAAARRAAQHPSAVRIRDPIFSIGSTSSAPFASKRERGMPYTTLVA